MLNIIAIRRNATGERTRLHGIIQLNELAWRCGKTMGKQAGLEFESSLPQPAWLEPKSLEPKGYGGGNHLVFDVVMLKCVNN